jgi:aspartyl protease family protein
MSEAARSLGWVAATFVLLFGVLYWALGGLIDRRQNPNDHIATGSGAPERVELAVNPGGQYIVPGTINGHDVDFLVDTGATHVAVPASIAEDAGLERGAEMRVQTAGGTRRAWHTTIDRVAVGGIERRNVRGSINPSMPGDYVLLGMTFLRDLELRQQGDRLVIENP